MKKLDLMGQRFGRLTVLEEYSKRAKNRSIAWACRCDCGDLTEVNSNNLQGGNTRSCGCFKREESAERMGIWASEQTGENSPSWKGGRTISTNGYMMVKQPEHPNAWKSGYIKESHLVMEQELGRYLTKEEVVHHNDKNRINDEPENLRLFENQTEHQRYETSLRKEG